MKTVIKAYITVASNMSDETYNTLVSGIKAKYSDEVVFTKTVDDSCLGGFILTINGTVYDNSVKTQLKSIKKHLGKQ